VPFVSRNWHNDISVHSGTLELAARQLLLGSGVLAECCTSMAKGAVAATDDVSNKQAAALLGTFHVAHVGLVTVPGIITNGSRNS